MEKITCDICKGSCAYKFSDTDIVENEYATLQARWGFLSNKDLEKHKCVMCESCYDQLVYLIENILHGKVNIEYYGPWEGMPDDSATLLESEEGRDEEKE